LGGAGERILPVVACFALTKLFENAVALFLEEFAEEFSDFSSSLPPGLPPATVAPVKFPVPSAFALLSWIQAVHALRGNGAEDT